MSKSSGGKRSKSSKVGSVNKSLDISCKDNSTTVSKKKRKSDDAMTQSTTLRLRDLFPQAVASIWPLESLKIEERNDQQESGENDRNSVEVYARDSFTLLSFDDRPHDADEDKARALKNDKKHVDDGSDGTYSEIRDDGEIVTTNEVPVTVVNEQHIQNPLVGGDKREAIEKKGTVVGVDARDLPVDQESVSVSILTDESISGTTVDEKSDDSRVEMGSIMDRLQKILFESINVEDGNKNKTIGTKSGQARHSGEPLKLDKENKILALEVEGSTVKIGLRLNGDPAPDLVKSESNPIRNVERCGEREKSDGRHTGIDGHVYDGEYSCGKREGIGRIVYFDTKDTYHGQWVNDSPHGEGVFIRGDGFGGFRGKWEEGRLKEVIEGFAEVHDDQGNLYQGQWLNGQRHGEGRILSGDGVGDFIGMWENGELQQVKEGLAHVVNEDGTAYAGEFLRFKKHGIGTLVMPNGMSYRGNFCNGSFHGHGVLLRSDGSVVFDGIFDNGLRKADERLHRKHTTDYLENVKGTEKKCDEKALKEATTQSRKVHIVQDKQLKRPSVGRDSLVHVIRSKPKTIEKSNEKKEKKEIRSRRGAQEQRNRLFKAFQRSGYPRTAKMKKIKKDNHVTKEIYLQQNLFRNKTKYFLNN